MDNDYSSVPGGSAPSTPTSYLNNPNSKQVEMNWLLRWYENSPSIGIFVAWGYAVAAFAKDMKSDGITAVIQVGNALGNLAGIILAKLLHKNIKEYYRTGEYNIKTRAEAPDDADIDQMKKGDIFIYEENGELHYVVKYVGKSFIKDKFSSYKPNLALRLDLEKKKQEEAEEAAKKAANEFYELSLSKQEQEEVDARNAALAAAIKIEKIASYQKISQQTYQVILDKCRDNKTCLSSPVNKDIKSEILEATAQKCQTYSGKTSLNPLYRVYKTLVRLAMQLAFIVVSLLGNADRVAQRLTSYIFSSAFIVIFGLFAGLYWFGREKILGIPPNSPHEFDLTGYEGWSKYARTAQAMGTQAGQAIGGFEIGASSSASSAANSFVIGLWSAIVGVLAFTVALLGVPFINWVSSKFTKNGKGILTTSEKNLWKNNFVRTGMYAGAGPFALLGLIVGNWWLDPIMAATILSAVGSVIGGIAMSIWGHDLHNYMHPSPGNPDIDNTYDYGTRAISGLFGYIGAAAACCICPGSALMVAPIGTAIAGGIGWVAALYCMRLARRIPGNEEEIKAEGLPWTQCISLGSNEYSAYGGGVGILIGYSGLLAPILPGAAALIFAISFCSAGGAVYGALKRVFENDHARNLFKWAVKMHTGIDMGCKPVKPAVNSTALTLTQTQVTAVENSDSMSHSGSDESPSSVKPNHLKQLRINLNDSPLGLMTMNGDSQSHKISPLSLDSKSAFFPEEQKNKGGMNGVNGMNGNHSHQDSEFKTTPAIQGVL